MLRAVPADLVAVLRAMRRVEQAAQGLAQHRRAAHGSAALLLTATDAGWSIPELSQALGVPDRTLHGRIARARQRTARIAPGLLVTPPPTPPTKQPRLYRHWPVEQREWLYASEACTFARISYATLVNWRKAGLLPAARPVRTTQYIYDRDDFERIARAPAYNGRGVRHSAVLGEINAPSGHR